MHLSKRSSLAPYSFLPLNDARGRGENPGSFFFSPRDFYLNPYLACLWDVMLFLFLEPLSAEYCTTALSLSLLRGKLLFSRREILQIRGRGRFHIFRHLFSMRASEFLQFPYSRLECFFRPETYANTLLFPCMVETFHDWGEPKYAEVETVLLRDFQEASCFFYIFFSRKKVQKRE